MARGIEYKTDATYTAFCKLEGVINKRELARQYFRRPGTWFSSRLDGCADTEGNETTFTGKESHQLAESFRDIAKRLRGVTRQPSEHQLFRLTKYKRSAQMLIAEIKKFSTMKKRGFGNEV